MLDFDQPVLFDGWDTFIDDNPPGMDRGLLKLGQVGHGVVDDVFRGKEVLPSGLEEERDEFEVIDAHVCDCLGDVCEF